MLTFLRCSAAARLGCTMREETQSDSLIALKMQEASGSVTPDVVHLGAPEGAQAADQGLLEPLDDVLFGIRSLGISTKSLVAALV